MSAFKQAFCPRCKINPLKRCPAMSRRDNKTKICSECGTAEALEDSRLTPPWKGKSYWDVDSDIWKAQMVAKKELSNELS